MVLPPRADTKDSMTHALGKTVSNIRNWFNCGADQFDDDTKYLMDN